MSSQTFAITSKDLKEARRDGFFTVLTSFIGLAAIVALVTGAIALATDVATYNAAKETLLALGKSLDVIASPEFYPLKLLRGAIEQIEIVGAVLGILVGFRTAVAERGRQTLALVLTRPLSKTQFLLGKVFAGTLLIAISLFMVFAVLAGVLAVSSGVPLSGDDLVRIGLVWVLATSYVSAFFLLSMLLTFTLKHPSSALLASFVIWLLVVLIAPQIGDTLDPDNQVAGGVFKQLHIPKVEQERIKQGFATYELVRNGIEAASVTKHFERASFAILGIKDTYTGQALTPILTEKRSDIFWIFGSFFLLSILTISNKLKFEKLSKES